MVGGKPQTPIAVDVVQKNSPHWRASQERVSSLAKFFLKAARPHYLRDAPGSARYLSEDETTVARGKRMFAAQCAVCHSSKSPDPPTGIRRFSPEYDVWSRTADFTRRMTQIVMQPDFLDDNYLSTDRRYPVSAIGTNACSTLASNALRGHIWDNFSSETYKNLPAVGTIAVQHPLTGKTYDYPMPGSGRGYHRVPSLVSLWATAPYFHNNALGEFTNYRGRILGQRQYAPLLRAARALRVCRATAGFPE